MDVGIILFLLRYQRWAAQCQLKQEIVSVTRARLTWVGLGMASLRHGQRLQAP